MKGLVKQVRYVEVEILPGDKVEVDWMYAGFRKVFQVRKLVETGLHTYAVLSNGTWRPMTTYGITWRKVD